MKKIIFLALCILIISLFGCSNGDNNSISSQDVQIVVEPNDETANTLNGYRIVDNESAVSDDESNYYIVQYIGNKNSKKFHIFNCPYAAKTKEENIVYFDTSIEALNSGYSPCSRCNP